ncbi:MAG: hypothetical protein WCJ40_05800 [Planctomycetota bacterium]
MSGSDIKLPAMQWADDLIALDPSPAKWCISMRTPAFEDFQLSVEEKQGQASACDFAGKAASFWDFLDMGRRVPVA